MGNESHSMEEIQHIRRTPALNRFLFFLSDCGSQSKIDSSELEEIKNLMPVDGKHVFHFILSACLADKELEQIFLSDKTEAMFPNVSFVLDDDEMEKLSKEMYVNIVLELGLVEECLCMILTNPGLKIMRDVAEALTERLIQGNSDKTITISFSSFDTVLATFVKLSKVEDELLKVSYRKCTIDLVNSFVACQFPEALNCDKLVLIFRLIGVSIVHEHDYQNADELSVLLEEWELDKSRHLMNSTSMKIYEALFNTKSFLWGQNGVEKKVIEELDKCLPSVVVDKLDENFKKEVSVSSHKLSLSCYLGGCAYLIKMILKRHWDHLKEAEIPNTLKCIEDFVEGKPKMKHEEVIAEIHDFRHFCERISKYGNRDIYKRDWVKQFLLYSVDEILGTSEGNKIAEAFIVGAEQELVLEFISKVREVDRLVLDDSRKELIIKILTHERIAELENQGIFKALFQNGANDKLELENFKTELHILTLQLGAIEFEKDASKLNQHKLGVIRMCLQNPVVTILKILDQSIKTEHFRALEFASPFFSLPTSGTSEDETEPAMPPTLIIYCFSRLVKRYPDYPNSLYDSLSSSMEFLITHDIISAANMFAVSKFQIVKIISGSRPSLSKVVGLFSLIENLVKFIAEKGLLREIATFVVNISRGFSLFTDVNKFSEAVRIKNILSRIMKYLSKPLADDLKCEVTTQFLQKVEDLSIFEQGLLYIRCEQFRPLVKKTFEESTDELSFADFVRSHVVLWILNSNEEEWGSLVEFMFNVAMSSNSKLYKITKINKMHILNEALSLMYVSCVEIKCVDAFLFTLRFYGVAVEAIKSQFSEHEWYSLFETLISICVKMCSAKKISKTFPKEIVGLHQILSYLLSKVDDFANCNVAISRCDQLLSKLDALPQLDSKAEPIRWLVSEKFKQLQSSCVA